jgi:tRNA (guanine37-N1)-methyltransferase
LSGHHSAINSFRKAESLRKTYERRPDLLVGTTFSEDERKLLAKYFSGEDEQRKR